MENKLCVNGTEHVESHVQCGQRMGRKHLNCNSVRRSSRSIRRKGAPAPAKWNLKAPPGGGAREAGGGRLRFCFNLAMRSGDWCIR